MLQCCLNRRFLFRRAFRLLGIFGFGFVVTLPFNNTMLLFDLCNIQAGYLQTVFSLYPLFYLGIGRTAGQINFFRRLIVQVDMFAAFLKFPT